MRHLFVSTLLLLGANAMAIKVGDSVSKVTQELGEPTARVSAGPGKFILIYPRGDVIIKNGIVESVKLLSIEEFEKAKEAARKREAEEAERRKPKPVVEPKPKEPDTATLPAPPVPKAAPEVASKWYMFAPITSEDKHSVFITEFEAANYEQFTCIVNNESSQPIGPLTVVVRFICNDGCSRFNATLPPYGGDSSVVYPGAKTRFFGEVNYSRDGLNPPGGEQSAHFSAHGVTARIYVYEGYNPIPVGQATWVTKGFESKARKIK